MAGAIGDIMIRLLAALLLAFALLPSIAVAQERHMRVALVAESDSPRTGGDVAIALAMTPQPGWHGYWSNTGDAGTPDRVAWSLPDGVSVTALAYPVPQRLVVARLMNYVYAHPYALLGRLRIPAGLPEGTPVNLSASIDYLVCSDTLCVPEKADVALSLAVGDGVVTSTRRKQFDGWRMALPRPLGVDSHFAVRGGKIALAIPLPGAKRARDAYFYPAENDVIDYAAAQKAGFNGDRLILELTPKAGHPAPAAFTGVLQIERAQGRVGLAVSAAPGPVPQPTGSLTPKTSPMAVMPFLLTLLAAIAGGFILNAMPCVFPILSLKALSLARSGESGKAARHEALAYSAGVVLACMALGGIILLLRAGGESVGWAFQLQNPRITLALVLLMTAIGLNLAGLFDLPSLSLDHPGASANRPSGAFLTGVLAAFVATPCTGPFMGVALGGALVLPPIAALAVFAGLGLGLALPFLAIGYVPALRALLPRPGAWMETFRRILAVPMLLTALGLGWVLGRQSGTAGMTAGVLGALLLALALWWLGTRQKRGRGAGLAAVALIAAVVIPMALAARLTPAPTTGPITRLGGTAFSEARLARLRQQGRPVFVYFTADWCLTCKVNEQAAIDRAAVRAAFARSGVTVLVGDWTNGDPAISRFLESMGRSGVPLYLFYPRGGGEPQVLPQLLTPNMLERLG